MIRELHEKLVRGEETSVALTERYFAAIKEKDPSIGAYLTLLEESALSDAAAVTARSIRVRPGCVSSELIPSMPGS